MSRLLRMAYGHGGTRLERTLVSGRHQPPTPIPLRLRLLLVATWITVPVLVSLYAIPTTSLPMKTLIDISRLEVKPPPETLLTTTPADRPVPPAPAPTEVRPKPAEPLPPAPDPQRLRQQAAPRVEEVTRPAIERIPPATLPALAESARPVVRERRWAETDLGTSPTPRARRGSLPEEPTADRAAVSRARGAATPAEVPAPGRVAVARRQTSGVEQATPGNVPAPQRVARSDRMLTPTEEGLPRATAARERNASVDGGSGQTAPAAGQRRGVSLMSLEICASSRQQEDAVKAILAIVGSRESCRNERGEFQFKGTKRISSFNLIIYPANGRRLSNRCEELEDAYHCLTRN